jgi:hypothetical protein
MANELEVEMLRQVITTCKELKDYAYEIRMDWSDFDGRDLLKFVNETLKPLEAIVAKYVIQAGEM